MSLDPLLGARQDWTNLVVRSVDAVLLKTDLLESTGGVVFGSDASNTLQFYRSLQSPLIPASPSASGNITEVTTVRYTKIGQQCFLDIVPNASAHITSVDNAAGHTMYIPFAALGADILAQLHYDLRCSDGVERTKNIPAAGWIDIESSGIAIPVAMKLNTADSRIEFVFSGGVGGAANIPPAATTQIYNPRASFFAYFAESP